MKKNQDLTAPHVTEKTNPILLKAYDLMKEYAKATGARISVQDHNYSTIPELSTEMLNDQNICRFCTKHQNHVDVNNIRDLNSLPCRKMHINAIRESYNYGGSFTYVCPLGFMFWTSPIYLNNNFIGAIVGSGLLGTDAEETCSKMHDICGGALSKAKLKKMLDVFPRVESQKVKALAELTLLCAQSLSVGSNGYHDEMKRRAEQQQRLSVNIEELKSRYSSGGGQPDYPLEKEKMFLDALRQGDMESGKHLLNEILAALVYTNPDNFKYIQYRAMELAVLIYRIDTNPTFNTKPVFEAKNRHIKTIQEANNIIELTDALYRIVDDLAGQIFSFQGVQHALTLKRAEHYIFENFTRKVSLEEIAKASGFSAPYFSTIFKEEMGENLSSYLNRLRVEKACHLLTETNFSLYKIAHACGFEDQSWFSKIFKLYTGMSPGKYRNYGGRPVANASKKVFSDRYQSIIKKGIKP